MTEHYPPFREGDAEEFPGTKSPELGWSGIGMENIFEE